MKQAEYNIRVYGILINDRRDLLVSDERFGGLEFTKFPGGGLERDEGLVDCLKREFMEEVSISIQEVEHFYTTDFYQRSAFDENKQLISVYYKVHFPEWQVIETSATPFNLDRESPKAESYRWLALENLDINEFRWPIDKHVCQLLLDSE